MTPTAPRLLLAALKPEARLLARALRLSSDGAVWTGGEAAAPLVLGVTGMGPERAARSALHLMDVFGPREVVVAGFCGGLSDSLKAGDLMEPAEVIDARSGTVFFQAGGTGRLVSVDKVAGSAEEKRLLRETWQADAVDMETAAIAALCEGRRVPWRVIRAVSDDFRSEIPPDLSQQVDENGEVGGMGGYLFRHPQRLPSLIRLGLKSRRAGRSLGEAARRWMAGATVH